MLLANKTQIPDIGLGTWHESPRQIGDALENAVIKAGYRNIDCASSYGNEKEIGERLTKVFSSTDIKREELFISSKLWNTMHKKEHVEIACRQTLKDLQLEYLDLYLMHFGLAFASNRDQDEGSFDPNGRIILDNVSIQETWQAMEGLVELGLVKSIGVSNFTVPMLIDLLTYAKIHPYNSQKELVEFCRDYNIAVTAHSSLGSNAALAEGTPKLLEDKIILEIAEQYKKTPAQILLRWAVQRGTIPIPISYDPIRLKENIAVFDFVLEEEAMDKINSLNRNLRLMDVEGWWKIPYFS